ncbi:MAG: hypothetical protein ACXWLT_04090 [Rhizomicrobium sp.]
MRDIAIAEERNWALATYGLFLIAPASSGITDLIGVILAHLRLDQARGTLYESHYRNLILVFWVWLAVALAAASLAFAGLAGVALSLLQSWPGYGFALYHSTLMLGLVFLGVVLTCFWYYWRLIRGFIRILDDKPY